MTELMKYSRESSEVYTQNPPRAPVAAPATQNGVLLMNGFASANFMTMARRWHGKQPTHADGRLRYLREVTKGSYGQISLYKLEKNEDDLAVGDLAVGIVGLECEETLDAVTPAEAPDAVPSADAPDANSDGTLFVAKVPVDAESEYGISPDFVREAAVLALVSGEPGFVQTSLVDSTDAGVTLLLMSHGGVSATPAAVARLVKRGVCTVRSLAFQLFSALARLHAIGVSHRDVSSGNVLVDDNGVLTIVDFGAAALRQQYGVPSECAAMVQTQWFRAPETCAQYDESNPFSVASLGPEVDVWSAGVLVRWWATGHIHGAHQDVHEDENVSALRAADALCSAAADPWFSGTYSALAKQLPSAPERDDPAPRDPELSALLVKVFTIDPARRISAAGALRCAYFRHHGFHSPVKLTSPLTNPVSSSGERTTARTSPTRAHLLDMATWIGEYEAIVWKECDKERNKEHNATGEVYCASLALMEKFLDTYEGPVALRDLPSVGVACLVLSSKLRHVKHHLVEDICDHAGGHFTRQSVYAAERQVFVALNGDVDVVTPFDLIRLTFARSNAGVALRKLTQWLAVAETLTDDGSHDVSARARAIRGTARCVHAHNRGTSCAPGPWKRLFSGIETARGRFPAQFGRLSSMEEYSFARLQVEHFLEERPSCASA